MSNDPQNPLTPTTEESLLDAVAQVHKKLEQPATWPGYVPSQAQALELELQHQQMQEIEPAAPFAPGEPLVFSAFTDGDVILEITVENSARGQDTNIAGQNLPSFFSRKVSTKLRLRDGENQVLAGLISDEDRRNLWRSLGHAPIPEGALSVSVFAYESAPLAELLRCWALTRGSAPNGRRGS